MLQQRFNSAHTQMNLQNFANNIKYTVSIQLLNSIRQSDNFLLLRILHFESSLKQLILSGENFAVNAQN